MDISVITSKSLRDKKYWAEFPEYYELASVTENGLWHDNQNVLDHVIGVYAGLETVLEFKDLDLSEKNILNQYLLIAVGNQTRLDILKVATLLHDIAKIDTLVKWPTGMVWCPGHELIGAGRVKYFSERFNLDKKAELHVEKIVRFHYLIEDIFSLIMANQDKEKYFKIFNETVGNIVIELILLMHSDLLGCDLEKGDKKGYDDRIRLLDWMLKMGLKEIK